VNGIFGLIRKKAHITAIVKSVEEKVETQTKKEPSVKAEKTEVIKTTEQPESTVDTGPEPKTKEASKDKVVPTENGAVENGEDDIVTNGDEEEIPATALEVIKEELTQLLSLMGYTSPVEVSSKGSSVFCHVGDKHEKILTGQDGKTLDSMQYLLRKIIARKVPNRLRLTVDVGNYREKRLEELKVKAAELAEQVKATGKTQVIAALSPSERRVIHMSLQENKEIRSRSVGDGLFKKILIYKPGKGGRSGGRKRNNSRGRRSSNNRKKSE